MGRGRAPCCDKTQVVRGPWSPAEDIKLISHIQKYGHDNWRALPKQAGLLRCGKSCRLRWINYLRPDLKRGNFTKQEEDAIIQLHETIGNKWSKIAAHFPGRTDNEIKNIWNTHLKKRLSKKAGAEPKQEETSVITSSSSSSTTTAESIPKNRKLEIKSQIDVRPKKDETGPSEIAIAPNRSMVLSQERQSQNTEPLKNFSSSGGINQLEEFTEWGDSNLLETLLSAADEPEWGLNSQNTRLDSSENVASGGLNMETDIDLWSMLNNANQPATAPATEYMTDREIDFMFDYMDNEPGLAQISMEMHGAVNHGGLVGGTSNEASMDYVPLWPHSRT